MGEILWVLFLDYLITWVGLEIICFILLFFNIEITMTMGIAFPIWVILKIFKIITKLEKQSPLS